MDVMDVLLQTGLLTGIIVVYLIVFKKYPQKGHYAQISWNYPLKLVCARWAVRRWKARLQTRLGDEELETWHLGSEELPARGPGAGELPARGPGAGELPARGPGAGELPARGPGDDAPAKRVGDELAIRAASPDGCTLLLSLRRDGPSAELSLFVKLADGTTFTLPRHPDTLVGAWQAGAAGAGGSLRAAGLTLQALGAGRLRILYNGMLRRGGEATEEHVVFSFIWTDASAAVRHPEAWSARLAAQALASERWVDGRWQHLLEQCEEPSVTRWGCLQGQFEAFDPEGGAREAAWMRLRGAKVHALHTGDAPRRMVELVLMARDGTMVQLKAASYRGLTQVRSGHVRFPNCSVRSIVSTDFRLADFPESVEGLPSVFVINVSTANKSLRLVVRSARGGRLLGGAPYRRETHFLPAGGSVGGHSATGLLLLTGEPAEAGSPRVPLMPAPTLRFLAEGEAAAAGGAGGYCVALDAAGAACERLAGGKGASLALLTSVQRLYGFRVPPGFTLTTRALRRQLAASPAIAAAIRDIQACNEHYEEEDFKDKCNKAVQLFEATEVAADVMEEVREYLEDLIRKAQHQDMGPDLRFAVRSSAVGEDGEALSAAGQNATVLGCKAEHVLRAVRACWASMFAFTSANYRRMNGQECLCSGAVVVQVLARATVAGVLFTRHPARGDPSRLLITASYGLGESVVSGAVEPDTLVVARAEDPAAAGAVRLGPALLGSKRSRVGPDGAAAGVPAGERARACLGAAHALRLARVALALERAWAAPRDIEWAYVEDELFLLQARPITSLQRWSEQELLHELDTPIMSDDTIVSFANIGEVLPKPLSPLAQEILTVHMAKALQHLMGLDEHVTTGGITHYRGYLDLYNLSYRSPPPKIDMSIKMTEMAIHGHVVADENILRVARHINEPSIWHTPKQLILAVKSLFFSKWAARAAVKLNESNRIDRFECDDPSTLLAAIESNSQMITESLKHHMVTSTASTFSQIIAMSILLEGAQDFTSEHCSEVGSMLSSGETVSAVPQALERLARALEASGVAGGFRAQPPADALPWLARHAPALHQAVQDFLRQHGHRALMEFDVATEPWALQPAQLMAVLQRTPPPPPPAAAAPGDAQLIAGLVTPKKPITRKLLAWLLPLCRRLVARRELTKDQVVLAVHRQRLALRRLALLLARRWLLPDPALLFFFRLQELRLFLHTRDPQLLRKAWQRRQFWAAWARLRFPELGAGWPRPLARAAPRLQGAGARLQATPVCGGAGAVVARAAVIRDLADIGSLRQGDVLITHATDIGWSPYFPLIAGIVTELGGLISHGAVIAREYGLPCVVGAAHATELFQTGDLVRLSGTTGEVEKVEAADGEAAEAGKVEEADGEAAEAGKVAAACGKAVEAGKVEAADGEAAKTGKAEEINATLTA